MAIQTSSFEPADWNDADVLRSLQVYSPDRLSCFGKEYLPIWLSEDRFKLFEKCRTAEKGTTDKKSLIKVFLGTRHKMLYELIDAICRKSGIITRADDRFEDLLKSFPE
jgi:hypothetical protein